MSKKQDVLKFVQHKFFKGIDTLDEDLPIYEQAQKHERELCYYVTRTLNLHEHIYIAAQYLNPTIFAMLESSVEQDLKLYKSNPHDDSCVKSAMAFKMLIGE